MTNNETTGGNGSVQGHGFGTFPVFLASICTILGAILFLRFGYAVGHVGVLGTLFIILIGHIVTIPTALAIAEIATNRRVEGGGEYFIISRSFGNTIGASIGIALYLSQAISVAFYMIAFAEVASPFSEGIAGFLGFYDTRIISLPGLLFLIILMLTRGADMGVKVLWWVAGLLGVSLLLFFLGSPVEGAEDVTLNFTQTIDNPNSFIYVFAIVFPAFTGATAGVGLSGDLKNPRKSIPLGIISAVIVGILIYTLVVLKLGISATPEQLASNQLIMSDIALWGSVIPIVLIGLGAATLSSALGSILVAPRTLQAMANDNVMPSQKVNEFLAEGIGVANEPRNATVVTAILAFVIVALGNVDFVARIISMFFMVTYGALCSISFLEYFAARPSYRPSFRSKWYISLIGAIACFMLMFQMDPVFAIISLVTMVLIYRWVAHSNQGGNDVSSILFGVLTQASRYVQIRLQKNKSGHRQEDWRPSILMVNSKAVERASPIQLINWLSYRYGFGTYLHYIPGLLNEKMYTEAKKTINRLLNRPQYGESGVYIQSIISPSLRSALAQSLQVPGVSGIENNTVLYEFSQHDEDAVIEEIIENCNLSRAARMNNIILRHGEQFFGVRANVHVWLTWHDNMNANLEIILGYILIAHPQWKDAEMSVYAAFPKQEAKHRTSEVEAMISTGRIPISKNNIRIFATDDHIDFERLVEARSASADLVIIGFTEKRLNDKGVKLLKRFPGLTDVLFVSAKQRISME